MTRTRPSNGSTPPPLAPDSGVLNPLVAVVILLLAALACFAAVGAISLYAYRKTHPTVRTRRRELDRAVMMDEITDDEYADKTMALDEEEVGARLRRRVK